MLEDLDAQEWAIATHSAQCANGPTDFIQIRGAAILAVDTEMVRLNAAAKVLRDLLTAYREIANSGDAGRWDCEKDVEVIRARAALNALGY